MKKILLILFSSLFLVACGSNDENSVIFNGKSANIFTGSGFQLPLPADWTVTGSIASLPANPHAKVVVAAISPEKKYNFSENIIVLEQSLSAIGSSQQYSDHNHQEKKSAYQSYSLVESGDIFFLDTDYSSYYVFDAKYNTQTPKMRFIQTAKFCGTKVYFLHATINLGKKAKDFLPLFRGFRCKNEK